jgi:hypothetical protein
VRREHGQAERAITATESLEFSAETVDTTARSRALRSSNDSEYQYGALDDALVGGANLGGDGVAHFTGNVRVRRVLSAMIPRGS